MSTDSATGTCPRDGSTRLDAAPPGAARDGKHAQRERRRQRRPNGGDERPHMSSFSGPLLLLCYKLCRLTLTQCV